MPKKYSNCEPQTGLDSDSDYGLRKALTARKRLTGLKIM